MGKKKKKKIYSGVVKRDRWGRIIGIEKFTGKPRVVAVRGRGEVALEAAAGVLKQAGRNMAENMAAEKKRRGKRRPEYPFGDY